MKNKHGMTPQYKNIILISLAGLNAAERAGTAEASELLLQTAAFLARYAFLLEPVSEEADFLKPKNALTGEIHAQNVHVARYLDPKYSRWISADPAMNTGGYFPVAPVDDEAKKHNGNLPGMGGVFNHINANLYHYAGNNPIKYTDPDGRTTLEDFEYQKKMKERAKAQEIIDNYEKMINGARVIRWNVAADNMKHFLRGSGELRQIDPAWLQKQKRVRDAVSKNINRYKAEFREKAKNMPKGTSITVNEYPLNPESDYGPFGTKIGYNSRKTAPYLSDLYFASGTFVVTTFCDVTITKDKKGKVTVKGTMLHIWWDPYDWHNGLGALVPGCGYVKDEDANYLIEKGEAKPFVMRSNWSTDYEDKF